VRYTSQRKIVLTVCWNYDTLDYAINERISLTLLTRNALS